MRVLFLTFFFPPFKSVAAVRTGQTAKHLCMLGHDVRVVTADRQAPDLSLPLEVRRDLVAYTPWVGSGITAAVTGLGMPKADASDDDARVPARRPARLAVKRLVRHAQRYLLYTPDDCIGWYPAALRCAVHAARRWPPDLIFVSAGPQTGLLVAATVSRLCETPWVGELRDLWSDSHYRDLPPWFRTLDDRLETRVLESADGLVTVSEPWKALLARKYAVPVEVVYNGFEERPEPSSPLAAQAAAPLHVAHLGTLYGGKRDPTPLFAAIRILGTDARQIRVHFYGPGQEGIRRLAAAAGVAPSVEVHTDLRYADALAVQSRSDALLLLMWDRPEEEGVIPAKLFEYLGARRPVLAVGAGDGAAAGLIMDRGFGLASSDPSEIAAQLRVWIAEKRAAGAPAALPAEAVSEFSRSRQVARLSDFLTAVASRSRAPRDRHPRRHTAGASGWVRRHAEATIGRDRRQDGTERTGH